MEFWRGYRAHQEQLEDRFQALKGLHLGQVRLVISEGYVDVLTDEVLAGFCSAFPKLELSIDMLSMDELIADVAEARAHVGLAFNPPPHAQVTWVASSPQPVVLLVHPKHPLARRGRGATVHDLRDHPRPAPGCRREGTAVGRHSACSSHSDQRNTRRHRDRGQCARAVRLRRAGPPARIAKPLAGSLAANALHVLNGPPTDPAHQGGEHLVDPDRLGDVVVHARRQHLLAIAHHRVGRHRDHRQFLQFGPLA
jgi:DNA-binding transcriptional LysR family regulator